MSGHCLKVGLTGGIGSGKTTASKLFAALDVPVIDADVIARSLLLPGTAASRQVIEALGPDIAVSNSEVDRSRLRQRVFADEQARKTLESILHPIVRQRISDATATLSAAYCIIVIPLLFEAGQQDLVDRILVIDSPRELQIERARQRDHTTADDIQRIIDSQIPAQERLARADDIIRNDNGIEQLQSQVHELDAYYRSLNG